MRMCSPSENVNEAFCQKQKATFFKRKEYIMIIFAIIATILIVSVLWFLGKRLAAKIILSLALLAGGGLGIFVGFVLLLFMFGNHVVWILLATAGAISLLALLITFILVWWGRQRPKKRLWVSWLALSLALLIPMGISAGLEIYDENIPTVDDAGYGINYLYNPTTENNLLATLDGEASYKFGAVPITLDGATALYPVYAAFANETFPESALEGDKFLACSTTTGAYDRLIKGEVDMIFVASASKAQAEAAKSLGVEMTFTPIGREAFVFFVNSRNPLESITVEEIQGIYSGKITEWKQLGVKGLGDIRPFQRDEGSGSQTTLQKLMGDIPIIEPIMDDRIDGMGGIIERTADYKNYKNAIGYSFRFYSTEMVKNDQIKLLSIGGVAPTRENIINNSYPIAGDFYVVTTQNSDPRCAEFIEWILSDEGQELIEKTGYVGVSGGTQ